MTPIKMKIADRSRNHRHKKTVITDNHGKNQDYKIRLFVLDITRNNQIIIPTLSR